MPIADELIEMADAMTALQAKFVRSSGEMYLQTADQAEFKRLSLESKAMLDEALGRDNDFSLNLIHAINSGSGGFFGGPSYACVTEASSIIRGAVNQLRRRPVAQTVTLRGTAAKLPYVDPSRLAALRGIPARTYDPARLAQLCGELNVANENDCFMSIAMLVRAIVDHVPPIFGCSTFSEVANNYGGATSFKKSVKNLNDSLRNIADAHLHVQIRNRETLPTAVQVNFSADLDVLLGETIRLLQGSP